MNSNCPIAGASHHSRLARRIGCFLAAALLLPGAVTAVIAADRFPFDQELLLDAAPMRPAKRMPILTVSEDGSTTIDLWCRSVPARVQIADNAVHIETAPLPEALPQYMSEGQCSEARMQADAALLAAISLVTAWQRQGDGIVLNGPPDMTPLRFRASSH